MLENPIISVIIPIYNVGDYIQKCLDSVSKQSFESFEVLMVDDSSTDGSTQIAAGFAQKDRRFRLLKNTDGGVSGARNIGVKNAAGEYIAFIDSDDFVEPDYLKELYNAAKENNADVSYCNYAIYNPRKDKYYKINFRKPHTKIYDSKKIVKMTLADLRSRSYLWNKLWKKELFTRDFEISFPKIYYEDIATTSRLLYRANKVVVIDKCLYYYTRRSDSIVAYMTAQKLDDYHMSVGVVRNFLENYHDYKSFILAHRRLAFSMVFSAPVNALRMKDKKGYLRNIITSEKRIIYMMSGKFKPCKAEIPCCPYSITGSESLHTESVGDENSYLQDISDKAYESAFLQGEALSSKEKADIEA